MSKRHTPPCPPSLKQIQPYLKVASEHDDRDIVVSYWCRLYALQLALSKDKSSSDAKRLLTYLMDWLEGVKRREYENDAINYDIPAQAHLENYALNLFMWADSQDRASNFNKSVIKAFYTSAVIYDVLDTFGEVTEDILQNKKYAKWKATYIHNCIKNGETPIPGPYTDSHLSGAASNTTLPSAAYSSLSESTLGFDASVQVLPIVPRLNQNQTPKLSGASEAEPGTTATTTTTTTSTTLEITQSDLEQDMHKVKPKSAGIQLSPEQIAKAQKYCKWATSALNYDDVPTAVTNLQKALTLLTTGADE